jgi:hypothetical protein
VESAEPGVDDPVTLAGFMIAVAQVGRIDRSLVEDSGGCTSREASLRAI